MLQIARGMTARHIRTKALFPANPLTEEVLQQFQEAQVEAGVEDAISPTAWRNTLNFARIIRSSRADTVSLHYGGNWAALKNVLAVRLAGKRCVVSIHHAAPLTDQHRIKMTRLAGSLCHRMVVNIEWMRSLLIEIGVPAHKLQVIPLSVPPPARRPSRQKTRASLNLPPEAFVIGTLARLEPHKGIADLLRAFSQMPESGQPLRLVIAGEGSERTALETLAQDVAPGRVHFTGRVADTSDFYAALDLFALPSYEEGFGLVYLEAALHGVPSVGTRVGGIPVAIEEGKTGLLTAPGDITALASALQHMRDNPELRQRFGCAARLRAQNEFSEAKMVERYAQALFC